jgi:tetratricopeptide (TPR) repeat protein
MVIDKKVKRFSATLFALFLFFVFLSALTGCASLKEHLAMKDAAAAYKAGKWEDAAGNYKKALDMNRFRPENWKHLGFCYWNMIEPGSTNAKDVEATNNALDAFQNYLKLVKEDDQVQDYIINLYLNQNRVEDGIKFYEGLLAENPTDSRILYTLSVMYGKLGNFDKSLAYSKRKADLKPDDPSGYIFISAICWERSYNKYNPLPKADRGKIVEEGMRMVDKALALDDQSFEGHVYKNLLYRQLNDITKLYAEDEKDRRAKKDLLDKAETYLKKADAERDIAKVIRKNKSEKSTSSGNTEGSK